MNAFLELNKINYTNLKERQINNKKELACQVVAFLEENILIVQSTKVIKSIPLFMLIIYQKLPFQTFHYKDKCYISNLSKNQMNIADTWSTVEEIIRYLNSINFDLNKGYFQKSFFQQRPPKWLELNTTQI